MTKHEYLEKTIVEEIGGKVTKLKKTEDYYHVIVENEEKGYYQLNNGGYYTSTTKERINRYLGKPFYVQQIDFEWFMINRDTDEKIPFKSGMVLKMDTNEVIES